MIPEALERALTRALVEAGDSTPLRAIESVGGGDINQAARIVTASGNYFCKWNLRPLPRVFEVEARGLRLLQSARAVRVPEVIACLEQPPALVLEWIDGSGSKPDAAKSLGRLLAQQHRVLGRAYGLDHDNYIGANPQPNQPTSHSWVAFFRERRLGAQLELARRRGHLNGLRASQLERVMARLDEWIDEATCSPSLLHGDLWGGNFITGPGGEPVLIDPAVYYGDREADLAMTELFGGFPADFYAAYREVWPLDRGYGVRKTLYNLYHVLNHYNLFGGGYLGQAERMTDSLLAELG